MRVLIINTSEKIGGAAIAARRLMEALKKNGIQVKMLVRDKQTDHINVVQVDKSWLNVWRFIWERIVIWQANHFKKHNLFDVDIANTGIDITTLPEFRQADVIHLHWINQGFISLDKLKKIVDSGKPVVWTMHDMWPFTGICHYTRSCEQYKDECGNCPILYGGGAPNDLSHRVFVKKLRLLGNARIAYVGCSDWLANCARESRLLEGKRILSIPNPINTKLYQPDSKTEARKALKLPQDKKLLLFAAFRVTNKIKGIDYLCEAIRMLVEKNPALGNEIAIVAVGKESEALAGALPVDVYPMGYITNEHRMIKTYNACDLFLIPTLQDNLPNTIMESMACGVPCIGFDIGGLPQMIDHLENGYIARYKDSADFARGIEWALSQTDTRALGEKARTKVMASFSETAVAKLYTKLYKELSGKE